VTKVNLATTSIVTGTLPIAKTTDYVQRATGNGQKYGRYSTYNR
jgi:hypothetical protein